MNMWKRWMTRKESGKSWVIQRKGKKNLFYLLLAKVGDSIKKMGFLSTRQRRFIEIKQPSLYVYIYWARIYAQWIQFLVCKSLVWRKWEENNWTISTHGNRYSRNNTTYNIIHWNRKRTNVADLTIIRILFFLPFPSIRSSSGWISSQTFFNIIPTWWW